MSEIVSSPNAPSLQEVLQSLALQNSPIDEAKILYEGSKKCDCCMNWTETYPEDVKESVEATTESKRYAIILRLQKDHKGSKKPLQLHSIVVQSPQLKSVLGDIFADYPGITTTLEELTFSEPFYEFFHRWNALVDKAKELDDPVARRHTHLLIDTLTSQLGDVHGVARDLAQNNVITFDYLWTLFSPGALLYSCQHNEDRFVELISTEYRELFGPKYLRLSCKHVEWDGKAFGWKEENIEIYSFSGTRRIQDLEAYPAVHHNSEHSVRAQLLNRGRKFVSLAGYHHRAYGGLMTSTAKEPLSTISLFERSSSTRTSYIEERVIIDAASFANQTDSFEFLSPIKATGSEERRLRSEEFSDRLFLLCSPTVKGYGLRSKQWGKIHVSGVFDIIWNDAAFPSLVIASETKRLIASLVRTHGKRVRNAGFDDIIKGKGQGMIFCLTGAPGVGKTLTAEAVAEEMRAPLYVVSAGELGTSTESVEKKLTEIFEQAFKWNAVLLLDESDVYLEERTPDHLERNQLVCVFLRMLEYYRGVMFLTTNRVASFDVAFQSRIDLMLHYDDLDFESRRSIWALLLGQVAPPPNITEKDLDAVAEKTINGRQIKNAVKAAQLQAADEEAVLSFNYIDIVLKAMFPAGAITPDPPVGAPDGVQQAMPASLSRSSSPRPEDLNPRGQDSASGSNSLLTPSKRERASQLRRRWKQLTGGRSRK